MPRIIKPGKPFFKKRLLPSFKQQLVKKEPAALRKPSFTRPRRLSIAKRPAPRKTKNAICHSLREKVYAPKPEPSTRQVQRSLEIELDLFFNRKHRNTTTHGDTAGWYLHPELAEEWSNRPVRAYRKIRQGPRKLKGDAVVRRHVMRQKYQNVKNGRISTDSILTIAEQSLLKSINAKYTEDPEAESHEAVQAILDALKQAPPRVEEEECAAPAETNICDKEFLEAEKRARRAREVRKANKKLEQEDGLVWQKPGEYEQEYYYDSMGGAEEYD